MVFWHKWHSQTQDFLNCWWEWVTLYLMRLSSVYHMRTSSAFLFKPRAAIPSARLPPVNLSSAERTHFIKTLFKKHDFYKLHFQMRVILHIRLHRTTEKQPYRCSNRVRPFPLQCWSSPQRRQDLGRGNNMISKCNEVIRYFAGFIVPKISINKHFCWFLNSKKAVYTAHWEVFLTSLIQDIFLRVLLIPKWI